MSEIKINLDNTYMNVIQFGHGTKVLSIIAGLSLSGLEGQGNAVAASYGLFEEEYTVYLFDRKKVVPEGYTIREMAKDVWYCLNELNVKSTAVYGVSQGGMIGQWLALDHPEMVEKLIVCSSMSKPTTHIVEVLNEWISIAKTYDVVNLNRSFFKHVYSKNFLESVKDLLPQLEKVGTHDDCDRFINLANSIYHFDVYEQLKDIKCPVFVLGDKNDDVIGVEGSSLIAEKCGCDIYLYDSYSHAVYDEASDIKERIFTFLTQK